MVYVVLGHWNYEGAELLGVYATREAALARQAEEIRLLGHDDVTIEEHVPQ